MKVKGKETGEYCVVVKKPENSKVTVDGKNIKRKETSILHLEPLPVVLDIKEDAGKDEIIAALEKEGY